MTRVVRPKYLEGSIFHHIIRMTASGGFGLLALFAVDLVDLFFISLLGESELAAAVGFAASVLFFTQSLSIGLSIAIGATVSRALGKGDDDKAAELYSSGVVMIFLTSGVVAGAIWFAREPILQLLGADGETLRHGSAYLAIVIPSFPFVAVGMASGGVMRAQGDARSALWLTLSGALVNAILDPLLIFGLGLGLPGAAIASALSRLTMFYYGLNKVVRVYKLACRPSLDCLRRDFPDLLSIAIPSVLTNLSTPIGIAYVTASMAQFGDSAVAGTAIVTRLQMVAFVGLFALSGTVGPIAGQNWGGQAYDRVQQVLSDSIRFILIYCLAASLTLAVLTEPIIFVFQASDQAADLIRVFTWGLSLVFIFNGITFVTNALFNNLGAPKTSTLLNFAKATVFTVPFVWAGAKLAGPEGILIGQALGAVLVAIAGYYWCRRLIINLAAAED